MSQFKIGQLYDQAFKKLSPEEIKDNLEAIYYGVEERNYTVNLTEEQIAQREKEHSKISIEIADKEDDKKDYVKSLNNQLKDLKSRASHFLKAIRFKSEQRYGKLYLVDDHDHNMMYFFDQEGVCVDARPMTKQEYQKKLKIVNGE